MMRLLRELAAAAKLDLRYQVPRLLFWFDIVAAGPVAPLDLSPGAQPLVGMFQRPYASVMFFAIISNFLHKLPSV